MINGSRYDFVKIEYLTWEEILTYSKKTTHWDSVKVLKERFPGSYVSIDKVTGGGYKIRIRFYSEADEAEFMLRESA